VFILIAGLGIIWVYLRRYRARPKVEGEAQGPAADAGADAQERVARIEEELKAHRG